jgi:uncharacterized protein (DUF1800 family)
MLKPYAEKLTQQTASHLMKRLTFAQDPAKTKKLIGLSAAEAVSMLLDAGKKAPMPAAPSWLEEKYLSWWRLDPVEADKQISFVYKRMWDLNYELKYWWHNEMEKDDFSVREKMTLFWHGHFTTKFAIDQVLVAPLMYNQTSMFRSNHLGNFRTLVENICTDGAMLVFLNGENSTKTAPNENFSRELLELYTCGIGNYTEEDVKEGAKVFTGFKVNQYANEWTERVLYKTFLNGGDHDTSPRKYLGVDLKLSPSLYTQEVIDVEIKGLVNTILTQRGQQTAEYLCRKLYKYFVYSNDKKIDNTVIASMVETLIKSNWEVQPVLQELFSSDHFFNAKQVGVQIKTPAETVAGFTKHFNVGDSWKNWIMTYMGLELLNPPNVAGWPGYRQWLDAKTYPYAIQQLGYVIWNQKDEDIIKWLKRFDNHTDVNKLMPQIYSLFLAKAPSADMQKNYLGMILGGGYDYEWPTMLANAATAANKTKYMISQLIKSPDFHLN